MIPEARSKYFIMDCGGQQQNYALHREVRWDKICFSIIWHQRSLSEIRHFHLLSSTNSTYLQHVLIQFSSVTQSCLTLCDPMDCSAPVFPVHHQFPQLTQTHVHGVHDAIQPSHPLLLPPSIFPSLMVSSSESVLRIRGPKYQSFNFSINPSDGYSGLIPLRMDWLDLIAVQETLKSLLQHHMSQLDILNYSVSQFRFRDSQKKKKKITFIDT